METDPFCQRSGLPKTTAVRVSQLYAAWVVHLVMLETELATVPAKVLELWASKNFPVADKQFQYKTFGKSIPYEELDLEQQWKTIDIQHERNAQRN